jgi:hypothetical protein
MWSLWNAPSGRDYYVSGWERFTSRLHYYDPFGAYCNEDEPEICEDCSTRGDRGEACEDWCETNRPEPEPAPISRLTVEEPGVRIGNDVLLQEAPLSVGSLFERPIAGSDRIPRRD